MKNISYNLDCKINQSLSLFVNKKLVITEQQILELQDLFLTPGIHYINVATVKNGRSLIYTFLNALRCYNAPACLTNNAMPLKKEIHLLNTHSNLDHFFIEESGFDFMWIEARKEDYWYVSFKQRIEEMGIDQHIPVLILLNP